MTPSISYYCPCDLPSASPPPPPHLASSSSSFHPLHTLFFCEECDAVRCNRCVAIEVSGYYCPNCLFEVPSASVRSEKNRCARNCFLCPHCHNTLSVVPSDPPDDGRMGSSTSQLGTLGEPPFLLYCNNCRWDSQEVGITFEKPTGLAQQLQKSEDSAPESLEFERLKEHFEPFLRASAASLSQTPSTSSHHHTHHINPITAAASSALARDIPGVGKYHPPPPRSRTSRKNANKDEMATYKSRLEIGTMSGLGSRGDLTVEKMRRLENPAEVATLEQIWTNSWAVSPLVRDLRPLRIPLHSRLTKRCQVCRHILIKPEQKAQSVRFKIKLVAANYLPAMTVQLPLSQPAAKRASLAKAPVGDDDSNASLLAGRTYPFQIALTNPLYDPIQVRLAVQRHLPSVQEANEDPQAEAKARRPPFAVSLPASAFSIAAFAEAWEYEDDEEMFDALEEDDRFMGAQTPNRSPTKSKSKTKTVGVLERRANLTVVGGEVIVSKEARGNVKFNMLVSYTYRSDEPLISEDEKLDTKSRTTPNAKAAPEMKTFSFYTVVDLGPIVPREESRVDSEL